MILLDNMEKLGIDLDEIQIIVLSHIHRDHMGGIFGVLERNSDVDVYVPASFPEDFKLKVRGFGCRLVEVKESLKICNGIMTTGELGARIKEQSLIINSARGLIVITGCAYPGIVKIVEKAMELNDRNVYLVIGGFHLGGLPRDRIETIVKQFKTLGVEKVALCHCSGDLARNVFKDSFGNDCIEAGIGRNIKIKRAYDSAPED